MESILLGEGKVWSSILGLSLGTVVREDGISHSIGCEPVVFSSKLVLHEKEVGVSVELVVFLKHGKGSGLSDKTEKGCNNNRFHFYL